MLREFDNIQGKEKHTTNPMKWNSIREIEIMSHGKPSTATQLRIACFQFTPELRVCNTLFHDTVSISVVLLLWIFLSIFLSWCLAILSD